MSFDLLALLGGCFIAAFCSGLAGFAFNLVAAGILYHWVTPQEIAPVLIVSRLEEFAYAEATTVAVLLLAMSLTLLIVVNTLQQRLARNAQ